MEIGALNAYIIAGPESIQRDAASRKAGVCPPTSGLLVTPHRWRSGGNRLSRLHDCAHSHTANEERYSSKPGHHQLRHGGLVCGITCIVCLTCHIADYDVTRSHTRTMVLVSSATVWLCAHTDCNYLYSVRHCSILNPSVISFDV